MAPTPHHLQPILTETLLDPFSSPVTCIYGLHSGIVQIYTCGADLPYQVSFLQAAMKFMSTPRTDAERLQLRTHLFQCHCDARNTALVQLHHPLPPGVTASDIYELTLFYICKMLQKLIVGFDAKGKDVKKRWPTRYEDICPLRSSVPVYCDALVGWGADGVHGSACFTLLGAAAWVWPELRTYVLATPRIFALATTHLEQALTRIPTQNASVLYSPRFSTAVFACAADFFHVLAGTGPLATDTMLAPPGIMPRMYQVALRMQAHLAMGPGDAAVACEWFNAVCRQNGSAFVPGGAAPPPPKDMEHGYMEHVWGLLVQIRNTKCSIPGCTSATASQVSRVCGACGTARYCSKAHQHAAWNARPHPHKALCARIQDLRRALHMEDAQAWTRLIHDTEAERCSLQFRRLCTLHDVKPMFGRAILVAVGYPGIPCE
ncbi:hypothetical protein DFH07DRAFT_776972 [Mycena maculata]|uniref:MYND-type domain-containing protein n=1 Tax=Mycena maculata TaxID=230809 RepID=A0AAD7N437_9AGAR|nr:hypothetical protein DFH07DRAFT_776972 [Mycena maculata]